MHLCQINMLKLFHSREDANICGKYVLVHIPLVFGLEASGPPYYSTDTDVGNSFAIKQHAYCYPPLKRVLTPS